MFLVYFFISCWGFLSPIYFMDWFHALKFRADWQGQYVKVNGPILFSSIWSYTSVTKGNMFFYGAARKQWPASSWTMSLVSQWGVGGKWREAEQGKNRKENKKEWEQNEVESYYMWQRHHFSSFQAVIYFPYLFRLVPTKSLTQVWVDIFKH